MEDQVAPGVSAVVLAAGANTRLSVPGVVPPFMKPLLLVNGRPLIKHALDHALKDWCCKQVVVVVGPDNAKLITDVVLDRNTIDWVLQPRPTGVIDALDRALPLVKYPRTLILCADNTFDLADVDLRQTVEDRWLLAGRHGYVGTRSDLSPEEARRFTPIGQTSSVWIGPLLLPTGALRGGLVDIANVRQLLDQFTLERIEMRCEDLGIPEAL